MHRPRIVRQARTATLIVVYLCWCALAAWSAVASEHWYTGLAAALAVLVQPTAWAWLVHCARKPHRVPRYLLSWSMSMLACAAQIVLAALPGALYGFHPKEYSFSETFCELSGIVAACAAIGGGCCAIASCAKSAELSSLRAPLTPGRRVPAHASESGSSSGEESA